MTLENQLTSLELSENLRDLHVTQKSAFHWVLSKKGWNIHFGRTAKQILQMRLVGNEVISAFTVAELGEMLKKSDYYLPYTNEDWTVWECRVGNTEDGEKQYIQAKTEADCRAKMLIYLLENKLITL